MVGDFSVSLSNKIVADKTNVMMLAMIIGIDSIKIPYASHKTMPVVNITYIAKEIDAVSRDLIVLIVCGRKAAVVKNAAM